MRTLKVFVLTQQGRDNQDQNTLEVVGVYSTKTAAEEKFKEKQEDIRQFYDLEYPEEYDEYDEGFMVGWGCSCNNSPVYDELLITEKEVDND